MVGLVLCSHGNLAPGLLEAAELILGAQEGVQTTPLSPEDSLETMSARIRQACAAADNGDGVLILADLLGGTPFNASALQLRNAPYELITGMNLPMLIEVLSNRDYITLPELASLALEAGCGGIRSAREALQVW